MVLSAGLLLYKRHDSRLMFFLVHPGGPFFVNKHEGSWTVPKGLVGLEESPLEAAKREFEEETGHRPSGSAKPLQPIIQKGGKKVLCWAIESDLEITKLSSNTFELVWPPKSGKIQIYPEVDKYGWFDLEEAKVLINERQIPFLEEVNGWY